MLSGTSDHGAQYETDHLGVVSQRPYRGPTTRRRRPKRMSAGIMEVIMQPQQVDVDVGPAVEAGAAVPHVGERPPAVTALLLLPRS